MTPDLDYAKLGRFLAGECSAAEAAEVRAWLAADPAHLRAFEALERLWRDATAPPPNWDENAAWAKLAAQLQQPEPAIARAPRRWFVAPPRVPWLRIAAALVLLLGSGWVVTQLRVGRDTAATPPMQEVATLRAQRALLRLQDGTKITLGVDSRLRYSQAFTTAETRDVYLEGEAYFEVAHDTLRPFLVHAGDAVTRVLGTRFAVRAYAEDRGVRVVVAEGRVGLGDAFAEVTLGRGDLGELKTGVAPVVRRGVDVASHLAWVDGRLVFADTPLGEVVQRLSRWYDIDVRLGDASLADDPYTMSLRGDEAPEHLLRTIAAAVGARLERRGTAYVIQRKPSEAP